MQITSAKSASPSISAAAMIIVVRIPPDISGWRPMASSAPVASLPIPTPAPTTAIAAPSPAAKYANADGFIVVFPLYNDNYNAYKNKNWSDRHFFKNLLFGLMLAFMMLV